jgi:hypothetical protein
MKRLWFAVVVGFAWMTFACGGKGAEGGTCTAASADHCNVGGLEGVVCPDGATTPACEELTLYDTSDSVYLCCPAGTVP